MVLKKQTKKVTLNSCLQMVVHCWAFVHFLITSLFDSSSTIVISQWLYKLFKTKCQTKSTEKDGGTRVDLMGGFDKDWSLCGAPLWGLLTQKIKKCQMPGGMPALPPLGLNIDRCITRCMLCFLLAACCVLFSGLGYNWKIKVDAISHDLKSRLL